jgi:protein SCO1/2
MVLGIVLLLLVLYRSTEDSGPVPPPPSDRLQRLSVIPPFSLTERGGRQITNRDLYGKVWVADFVYTTCPGPCPLVTAEMARVQDLIKDDPHAQLVTFTVDPENDTPGVLAAYADKYHALPDKWWFLTGPQQPMYDLIQNGFLQAVQNNGNATPEPGQYKVTHSTYFALVDAQGNMRQVYDSQSGGSERPDLLRDIKILEKEAGL